MKNEYIERLEIARNHFENAVGQDEVDLAIYEMVAAEMALAIEMKRQRMSEDYVN